LLLKGNGADHHGALSIIIFQASGPLLRSSRPTLEAPLAALFVLADAALWWWSRCNYPTHYLPTMRTVDASLFFA